VENLGFDIVSIVATLQRITAESIKSGSLPFESPTIGMQDPHMVR